MIAEYEYIDKSKTLKTRPLRRTPLPDGSREKNAGRNATMAFRPRRDRLNHGRFQISGQTAGAPLAAEILEQIVNGQQPLAQAQRAFQNQPEPELDTLIKLSRLFVFEHATKLMTGPEFAAQSSKTTKMVLNYISRQAKLGIKKSEIALAEKKLAARPPDNAPKQCLDKPKMDPEAGQLLRAAFAALAARQQKHGA
jgi:hypothetical protein